MAEEKRNDEILSPAPAGGGVGAVKGRMTFEQLKAEYDELLGLLSHNVNEVKTIFAESEVDEAAVTKARARYNGCIDAGDREGMDKALDELTAARKRFSEISNKFKPLRPAITTLHNRQQDLWQKVTELRKETMECLKQLSVELERTTILHDRVAALSGGIVRLAKRFPEKVSQVEEDQNSIKKDEE